MEKFPEYTEATPASGDQLDKIVELRPRQNPSGSGPPRISPQDLRPSALLTELPEFIARLASSNLEIETQAAEARQSGKRPAHVLELDDEEAGQQEHIDLEVFAGVLEEKKAAKPKIVLKRQSGDDNSDNEASFSLVSLNPSSKRKHIITEVSHNTDANSDESDKGESGEPSPKRLKNPNSARAVSVASTSSSEPDTSSEEESSDEIEEAHASASAERPTSRESNGSRDSNLSVHASSQGTRIRLVKPGTHNRGRTASPNLVTNRLPSPSQTSPTMKKLRLPVVGSVPSDESPNTKRSRRIEEVDDEERGQ